MDVEHRVAVLLPNRREFVIAFFGAVKIGAVPAEISFAVTSSEHALLLADSRARAIVTTAALWQPLRERRRESPLLRHVLIVGLRPGDVVVCGSPCFHAYPLGFTTYFAIKAGATVVLNSERSTPARMFGLVREHRATVFVGVPTLNAQMLNAAAAGEPADLSSVRACFAAAEPLPAELYRRWRERFGVEILDGIGTTEALKAHVKASIAPYQ